MINEAQARELLAAIQIILPEDHKFVMVVASPDASGQTLLQRISELPRDAAETVLRSFIAASETTVVQVDDFGEDDESHLGESV